MCSSVCPAVWAVLMCPPVPQLRTQDMALFKELKGNPEKPFSLTIEEPAPGTVACRLGEQTKPFVRKFFYLNGEPRHLRAPGQGAVWSRVGPGTPGSTGRGWAGCQDAWFMVDRWIRACVY